MDLTKTLTSHTGNAMPLMGLGTWELTDDTANVVEAAIKEGYRMFDTSSDYGTQAALGEGIRKSGISRSDVYIVTKIEETDDAHEAAKKYVEEIGLEYADLILIHRPPEERSGVDLWSGLMQAKNEGITRDIGVSNYPIEKIEDLVDDNNEIPVVNQIEWTPFGHSLDMLDYCKERGIIIQAYSPLTRAKRLDDEALMKIALKYSKTPAQLLIRWNMQLGLAPLPKANQIKHMQENIDVFDFMIDEDDMATLSGMNEEYSALGPSLAYL